MEKSNEPVTEEDWDVAGQALYYSTLALLDELPSYDHRARVVMHWVRYIIAGEADESTPKGKGQNEVMAAFSLLCREFAKNVVILPASVQRVDDRGEACGRCAACQAKAEAHALVATLLGRIQKDEMQ